MICGILIVSDSCLQKLCFVCRKYIFAASEKEMQTIFYCCNLFFTLQILFFLKYFCKLWEGWATVRSNKVSLSAMTGLKNENKVPFDRKPTNSMYAIFSNLIYVIRSGSKLIFIKGLPVDRFFQQMLATSKSSLFSSGKHINQFPVSNFK